MNHHERGRLGAHVKWSRCIDRTAETAPARAAFQATFDAQVPAEITDPTARAKAAESARRAYYTRLSAQAAAARRRRASTADVCECGEAA